MRGLLLKCPVGHGYTMKEACSRCSAVTVIAHPAKFSPDDKYARYRNPLAYRDNV